MVPNPILETHFFRVTKKRLQIFYILGGLCALPNGITSDRLQTFLSVTKKFKHTPMKTFWRHIAENFQRQPPVFWSDYVICRPHQALKSDENRSLKFLTVLEIFAKNPKQTTNFFRVYKIAHWQIFDTGYRTASTIDGERMHQITMHSFEKSRQIETLQQRQGPQWNWQ